MWAPAVPPVRATVPLAGWVAEAIVFGPASGSVSLVSAGTAVAAADSATVAASLTATGLSSTQVTVIDTVAVEPPLRVYVKVSAVPPVWLLQ